MFNCIANFNFFFYIRITGYLSEIFNFIDYCQSKSVGGGSNCFKQEILWRVSLWHDWPALPSSFCRASSLRSFTPNYKHDQAGIVNSIIDPFCFFCFGFFNFLPSWFVKSSFFFTQFGQYLLLFQNLVQILLPFVFLYSHILWTS